MQHHDSHVRPGSLLDGRQDISDSSSLEHQDTVDINLDTQENWVGLTSMSPYVYPNIFCWPTPEPVNHVMRPNKITTLASRAESIQAIEPFGLEYQQEFPSNPDSHLWATSTMEESNYVASLSAQVTEPDWLYTPLQSIRDFLPAWPHRQLGYHGDELFSEDPSILQSMPEVLGNVVTTDNQYKLSSLQSVLTDTIATALQESPRVMIAAMYSTNEPDIPVFECKMPACHGRKKTFGRWYDYKRHYDGAHAEQPTEFWCDILGCGRSQASGGRPFPRKDKLDDHLKKMHGI